MRPLARLRQLSSRPAVFGTASGVSTLALLVLAACGGGDGGSTAPPAVTSVAVSPSSVALNGLGSTASVSAALAPSNVSGTIAWRSADPTIATVSGSGGSATITAVAGGNTQIIANVGAVEGRTTVTVTPIVRTIAVASSAVSLRVGTSVTIAPTVGADAGANTALQWISSAPSIAAVSTAGVITGVSAGSSTITVSSTAFPSVVASIVVTVTPPTVQSISISPAAATLMFPATQQLTATIAADDGANTAVDWNSSAPAIASVTTTGLVAAVAPGTATITARSQANNSVAGTATITVTMPTVSVSITPANPRVLVGASSQLTAVVTAAAGVPTTVVWGTSAPTVASINNSGLVTALTPGTATITATSTANPTVSATTTVTVAAPTVTSLALSPTSATVFVGGTTSLTATVTADPGANTGIDWTSSNPAIATVSNNGVVTGVANGGPVTITARSQLVNSVAATAAITVTTAAWTGNWAVSTIGTGGALSNQLARQFWNGGLNSALVLGGFQGGNLTASVGAWLLRGSIGVQDITPTAELTHSPYAFDGNSPTDIMTFGFQSNAVISKRWNGSTFTDFAWPVSAQFNTPPASVSGAGAGRYFAIRYSGDLLTFDGTQWTNVLRINNGFGNGDGFVRILALSATTAIAVSCLDGTAPLQLFRIEGGAVTAFPSPTSSTCPDDLNGTAENDLMMSSSAGVARWNGTVWSYISSGLAAGETIRTTTQCGNQRYAASTAGRVFSVGDNTLTPIARDGEALAAQNYTFLPLLKCAPDGTLRAASGNMLLTRRSGSTWIDEHYAPDLNAVAVVGTERGIATGTNVVYDWTPFTGWRVRWRGAGTKFHGRSIAANADGSATLGGTINEGVALIMDIDASNAVHIDTIPNMGSVTSLWRSSANGMLYAGTTNSLNSLGSVLRRATANGAWETVASLPSGITAIAGRGASAIAVSNGQMLRFDGSNWNATSGPVRPVSKLAAIADNVIYGGTCQASNDAIFIYNGNTWTEQNTSAVGSFACVLSIWGTGVNDVFALVGTSTQRLIHWDGSSWSNVSISPMTTASAGAGVPGLSLIVGRRGLGRLGLPLANGIRVR